VLYGLNHTSSHFAIFALVIFEIGFHFFVQASLGSDPPILGFLLKLGWKASTTQLLVEMRSCQLFPPSGLKPLSSQSQPPTSPGLQVWATSTQLTSFLLWPSNTVLEYRSFWVK
jgi:hypothetical protein